MILAKDLQYPYGLVSLHKISIFFLFALSVVIHLIVKGEAVGNFLQKKGSKEVIIIL